MLVLKHLHITTVQVRLRLLSTPPRKIPPTLQTHNGRLLMTGSDMTRLHDNESALAFLNRSLHPGRPREDRRSQVETSRRGTGIP
ncbi:hypothetical protein EYF80_033066 [Liparis tanakae]|uniref:Uncharacterized protein n=1 Tax=Liparis tanakae TaxID=230148 RepID=A0A4Z2GTR3_9TELE|nr:hypothetical protein EYF80_033066 [Liparis tanakae]